MSDKITVSSTTTRTKSQASINPDLPGKISEIIGSGKHAQAAIVWQTIKWSFIAGGAFSIMFFVLSFFTEDRNLTIDHIKGVWSIFIPVITLALGYIFGKGKE